MASMSENTLQPGRILTGSLFNEPMRVETVRPSGVSVWMVGLVGLHSERFRNVTLTAQDLEQIHVQDSTSRPESDITDKSPE